jgi:hypothetical protein
MKLTIRLPKLTIRGRGWQSDSDFQPLAQPIISQHLVVTIASIWRGFLTDSLHLRCIIACSAAPIDHHPATRLLRHLPPSLPTGVGIIAPK